MTTKHKIYFFFFLIACRLKGLKIGTITQEYSQDKRKWIKGCITGITGDSIDNELYAFRIGVNFFEPIQGIDSRCFNWGAYCIEQFKGRKIVKPNDLEIIKPTQEKSSLEMDRKMSDKHPRNNPGTYRK